MAESTTTTRAAPGTRYLDPVALARLKNLGLAARLVVEGLFSGHHRSPHRGFSVEFAEHRDYTPGVDPRHLDWKVFGRRDRLYVKQYEEQTNLRCYLLLDRSRSMAYRHSGALTKLEYACYCAASLAHLAQSQHDAFGLVTFAEKIGTLIPPRQGRNHLRVVMEELERTEPAGQTDLAAALHELAETIRRRALVVIFSDLFSGSADELLDAVGHLRHKKHEVLVFHVLDRAELEFPFRDAGQIEDMETSALISADAEAVRAHYLRRLGEHVESIKRGCLAREVGYVLADTSEPFEVMLGKYLARRQKGLL